MTDSLQKEFIIEQICSIFSKSAKNEVHFHLKCQCLKRLIKSQNICVKNSIEASFIDSCKTNFKIYNKIINIFSAHS